jgi:transposase
MMPFSLKLSRKQQIELETQLILAQTKGDLSEIKRIMALLSIVAGHFVNDVADILKISIETIRQAVHRFLLSGATALKSKSRPGRPPKLTKTQRRKLYDMIQKGPAAAGFPGACWRTPMIQHLIKIKFNVFYSVKYLSELLKNMGFSYQKATFVAANRDKKERKEWLKKTWPEILNKAKKMNAHILFGDEASFPQWGTLNYTWAPIGEQPVVETSGTRRSYKVFGLIDYFTGRFYAKGHEGKLNADSYIDFLAEVLSKTKKHIILIQDNAPYHTSMQMIEFFDEHKDRITVYHLPTFSPDYNPIEKLWKKVKQAGTHLHYFPTFESLILKVEDMLEMFSNVKKEVLSLFGFYDELAAA